MWAGSICTPLGGNVIVLVGSCTYVLQNYLFSRVHMFSEATFFLFLVLTPFYIPKYLALIRSGKCFIYPECNRLPAFHICQTISMVAVLDRRTISTRISASRRFGDTADHLWRRTIVAAPIIRPYMPLIIRTSWYITNTTYFIHNISEDWKSLQYNAHWVVRLFFWKPLISI